MALGVVVRVVGRGAAMEVDQRRRRMSRLLETIRCRLGISLMLVRKIRKMLYVNVGGYRQEG
jgi:hypothetical protein